MRMAMNRYRNINSVYASNIYMVLTRQNKNENEINIKGIKYARNAGVYLIDRTQ